MLPRLTSLHWLPRISTRSPRQTSSLLRSSHRAAAHMAHARGQVGGAGLHKETRHIAPRPSLHGTATNAAVAASKNTARTQKSSRAHLCFQVAFVADQEDDCVWVCEVARIVQPALEVVVCAPSAGWRFKCNAQACTGTSDRVGAQPAVLPRFREHQDVCRRAARVPAPTTR